MKELFLSILTLLVLSGFGFCQGSNTSCFTESTMNSLVVQFSDQQTVSPDSLVKLEFKVLNPLVDCLLKYNSELINQKMTKAYFHLFEVSRDHASEMIPLGMGKLFYHFPEDIARLIEQSDKPKLLTRDLETGYLTYLKSKEDANTASKILSNLKREWKE